MQTYKDVQIQTSEELLNKLLEDIYLENSTATNYTNISVHEFGEQARFNPIHLFL